MGTPAPLHINASHHAAATTLLDSKFPLHKGSHAEVSSYLVYFNRLMAIRTDGSTTGLVTSANFVSADGALYGPGEFVLSDGYTQVHICMRRGANGDDTLHPCIEEVRVESIALAS